METRVDGVGEAESVGGDDELLRQLAGQALAEHNLVYRGECPGIARKPPGLSDDDNAPDAGPM